MKRFHHLIAIVVVVGMFFSTLSCSSSKQAEESEPLENFGAKVDSAFTFDKDRMTDYLQYLYQNNQWQGGVAIMHNEKMMYLKNYGKLEEDKPRNADPGTKYRIGSITKMYTAAVINDLVAQGDLSMTSKLSRFYPEIPNATEINVDELLGHRSGIHNYTDDPEFDFQGNYTDEEIIDLIASYDSDFKPGTKAAYSNSNYFLLGKIIEKVTGYSYNEQLNSSILAPRNFMRTSYGHEIQPQKNEAYSFIYDVDSKRWEQVTPWQISVAGAAGGISASAGDVARFISDLYNSHLFPDKFVNNFTLIENDNFGYGAFRFPFYDKYSFGHTGGLENFHSMASYFPEEKISFVLLSNGLNELSNNDIAIGLLSILFDEEFDFPDFTETISVENTEAYLGNFSNKDLEMDIEVTELDGKLFAQATNQSKFPLTQQADGNFVYKTAGIELIFNEFDGEYYQGFKLLQGGGEFQFSRK